MTENKTDMSWLYITIIIFCVLWMSLFIMESRLAYSEIKKLKAEAVKHGYAEWKTGSNDHPEFAWKLKKEEK